MFWFCWFGYVFKLNFYIFMVLSVLVRVFELGFVNFFGWVGNVSWSGVL